MLAEPQILTNSFLNFVSQAKNILNITTETGYQDSLILIEYLFNEATDSEDEPLNTLIEIVSNAIERYESTQEDVIEFEKQVDTIDPGVSMLRILIAQFNLTMSDFKDEIGSKSLVSMILSGQRNLTKDHITKLVKRFDIDPALFF
ncbi:MAG: helix-turn-helix domain-containing protein [Proteobacteria bacterium]|nr:helix-turn-helix domain-containing protein [Pseudomonadota bacterium]